MRRIQTRDYTLKYAESPVGVLEEVRIGGSYCFTDPDLRCAHADGRRSHLERRGVYFDPGHDRFFETFTYDDPSRPRG